MTPFALTHGRLSVRATLDPEGKFASFALSGLSGPIPDTLAALAVGRSPEEFFLYGLQLALDQLHPGARRGIRLPQNQAEPWPELHALFRSFQPKPLHLPLRSSPFTQEPELRRLQSLEKWAKDWFQSSGTPNPDFRFVRARDEFRYVIDFDPAKASGDWHYCLLPLEHELRLRSGTQIQLQMEDEFDRNRRLTRARPQ